MALFTNFEQMAIYYRLTPKKIRTYHLSNNANSVTIWQKGKASLHFLKDHVSSEANYKNIPRMSYDGTPRAAYQIALNITHDDELKARFKALGVTL